MKSKEKCLRFLRVTRAYTYLLQSLLHSKSYRGFVTFYINTLLYQQTSATVYYLEAKTEGANSQISMNYITSFILVRPLKAG